MNAYPVQKIRNVCLLGHGGDGKTSLVESLLYMTKNIDRLGKVSDGNTVSDFDAEEIKRKFSISASVAPVEFYDHKFNFIDTPGYFDFVGEVHQAMRVADAAIIVCTAKTGVEVGTELAWKRVNEKKLPRMIYISKIDEENARYYTVYEQLREKFGVSVCPMVIPAIVDEKIIGIIDLIPMKAYELKDGAAIEMPIPPQCMERALMARGQIAESVAETCEEYMDKYFAGEEFTIEEYMDGVKRGVMDGTLAPVFTGSAYTGIGSLALLRGLVGYSPCPIDAPKDMAVTEDNELVEITVGDDDSPLAVVFKTVSDQYGKFSFFKVLSGKITSDMTLLNPRTGETEKIGHLYHVVGKKRIDATEISTGDIGAVSKLAFTRTGDTLCATNKSVHLHGINFPVPTYSLAVNPKAKGGEEKIASGLARLAEEDVTFKTVNNSETRQFVVTGYGDIHIDILCSKLKSRFNVEVDLQEPRVPYREKIRKKVKVQGRHKKQSGGHGQFGDVWIEFQPGDVEDLVFEEKVVGGAVPKNFFPAVEKGLRDSITKGVLAGFPVVYLKATLVDGSYHDVDSSEMAFKVAANLAYKAGLPQADPVILEPIGSLKVYIPDSYMGDVIGDLNKRRGRVLGMNPQEGGLSVVEAEVPMAEMNTYTIDLRSMTQGRGSFEFNFERYEDAPANIQQKIIEARKAYMEED